MDGNKWFDERREVEFYEYFNQIEHLRGNTNCMACHGQQSFMKMLCEIRTRLSVTVVKPWDGTQNKQSSVNSMLLPNNCDNCETFVLLVFCHCLKIYRRERRIRLIVQYLYGFRCTSTRSTAIELAAKYESTVFMLSQRSGGEQDQSRFWLTWPNSS